MTTKTRVVVVGGGLIGTWTALLLVKRGLDVILIEKGIVGAQSSGVNFGNLRLQGRHPGQYPLSLRSQALWENIEELIGDRCEFEKTGHLYVAKNDAEHEKLEQHARVAESHGLVIERIGRNELRRRWSWVGEEPQSATYSARDATANPRLVSVAVARAAQHLGAEIAENTRVTEVLRSGEGFTVKTANGRTIGCDAVVNAAGAWALEVAEAFGETAPMFAAGPPQFVTEPLAYRITPSVQAVDGSVIARQIPRGNVIFAGYPRTASDPVLNRAPVPPVKTLNGMRSLMKIAPFLKSAQVIRVWSGIEGYLPDMLPVIGKSETTPGLFHAFGFCGHGFQVGPGVAAVLVDLIVDGKTETPIDLFSINRFKNEVLVSDKLAKEFDAPAASGSRAG
ncbi:NAD(P)/FAD-dependent oxidoreductase [Microvirga guangxiensis]|uniref:Sarcosine oxidase subunit beta n=1 Tax=Microvirga guangxiensis TaxID=549386 RepID=A0A1G5BL80_9HYPH|nr:FAD-binding oxidoreductase [Microvirga guangxiensis]SCX90877.1 sarcosine oxidase subunit beta [Microvirga guangxiensis]